MLIPQFVGCVSAGFSITLLIFPFVGAHRCYLVSTRFSAVLPSFYGLKAECTVELLKMSPSLPPNPENVQDDDSLGVSN